MPLNSWVFRRKAKFYKIFRLSSRFPTIKVHRFAPLEHLLCLICRRNITPEQWSCSTRETRKTTLPLMTIWWPQGTGCPLILAPSTVQVNTVTRKKNGTLFLIHTLDWNNNLFKCLFVVWAFFNRPLPKLAPFLTTFLIHMTHRQLVLHSHVSLNYLFTVRMLKRNQIQGP